MAGPFSEQLDEMLVGLADLRGAIDRAVEEGLEGVAGGSAGGLTGHQRLLILQNLPEEIKKAEKEIEGFKKGYQAAMKELVAAQKEVIDAEKAAAAARKATYDSTVSALAAYKASVSALQKEESARHKATTDDMLKYLKEVDKAADAEQKAKDTEQKANQAAWNQNAKVFKEAWDKREALRVDEKKRSAEASEQYVADWKKATALGTAAWKEVGDAVKQIAIGYAAASVALGGMMAAASPATFSTFTGSLEMISRQIGMVFIPEVMKVSFWLQDVANWIRSMDPAFKEQIAGWAMMALKVGAAAVAFGVTAKAIMLLVAPITITIALTKALTAALAYMNVVLTTSGVLLSGLGIFAAVALLFGGGMALASHMAGSISGSGRGGRIGQQQLEGTLTADQVKQIRGAGEFGGAAGERQAGQHLLEQYDIETARLQEIARRPGGNVFLGTYRPGARTPGEIEAVNERVAGRRQAGRDTLAGVAEGRGPVAGLDEKHLASYLKEMIPQFSAIEQAREIFQKGALMDPIEQRRLQEQREAYAVQLRTAEAVETLVRRQPETTRVKDNAPGGMPAQPGAQRR